ncbi:hypothetical protein DSCW_30610 [Desulfosarcina widdelii]|uniref:Radical SAM core domain-containing protein n=1 Tax=Desulfosarcina widdelii TaxID=947919 RepID=A0A5K7ZB08_9BACT|nr:radical SAM protein [Desulfosarcina widdelii]BBO75644.1 hypothetical protein DSCW_30610 [Desulfosarcina widdelii]
MGLIKYRENVDRNRQEYADVYDSMKWLRPEDAANAYRERESLIASISRFSGATWTCAGTKLFTHALSPGCLLCGQGAWSCLFVNGICNARCFYCPSSQDDSGPPVTNTLVFEKAADYADYVNRFNIQGVSFSGGEPFLSFDRVLAFLEAVKNRVDHPVYTWLYTNGILATPEKLFALRDGGLNEIRFDLSADRYRLDALERAVGVIPTVTVEIPAIPEDLSITKKIIADLASAGVGHLNLHQIRCTPYNYGKLAARGYTFLHGPKVTVLETELAALELIRYSRENSIELPINYCSHAYQHQFQAAGARRRCAGLIKAEYEDVTPTGHIRRLTIAGPEEAVANVAGTFASRDVAASLYSLSAKRDSLSFAAELWPLIDFSSIRLKLGYSQAVLRNGVSYRHSFKKIALDSGKTLVVERQTVQPGIWLEGEQIEALGRFIGNGRAELLNGQGAVELPDPLNGIRHLEAFIPGLSAYY